MSLAFPPDANKLLVRTLVTGPRRTRELRLTLDTGSAVTVLPTAFLRGLGCDLSQPSGHTRLRGATGVARAPLIRVPAVSALGRVRTDLLVAAHDLPLGVESDGLLGLDFFRGLVLTLDFAQGRITLPGRGRGGGSGAEHHACVPLTAVGQSTFPPKPSLLAS